MKSILRSIATHSFLQLHLLFGPGSVRTHAVCPEAIIHGKSAAKQNVCVKMHMMYLCQCKVWPLANYLAPEVTAAAARPGEAAAGAPVESFQLARTIMQPSAGKATHCCQTLLIHCSALYAGALLYY